MSKVAREMTQFWGQLDLTSSEAMQATTASSVETMLMRFLAVMAMINYLEMVTTTRYEAVTVLIASTRGQGMTTSTEREETISCSAKLAMTQS